MMQESALHWLNNGVFMTPVQIATLDDKVLNRAIAEAQGHSILPTVGAPNSVSYECNELGITHGVDYLSDWNFLMPLVVKLGISHLSYRQSNNPDIAQYQQFNPDILIEVIAKDKKSQAVQRALAECTLLVLLSNNQW